MRQFGADRFLQFEGHTLTDEAFPSNCALIEVHVSDLKELFNSLDPTPFFKRDLNPEADEFIAGWARELRPGMPLGLLVHVDRVASSPDASEVVHRAVRDHFARRAEETRQKLRLLFRNGRIALVIGLLVVTGSALLGASSERCCRRVVGEIIRESLLIGGWVAMWRPLEVSRRGQHVEHLKLVGIRMVAARHPPVGTMLVTRARGTERRVERPASVDAACQQRIHRGDAASHGQVPTEQIQPGERQVLGADHHRNLKIAEHGRNRWDQEEEHHDHAVHGEELVVSGSPDEIPLRCGQAASPWPSFR